MNRFIWSPFLYLILCYSRVGWTPRVGADRVIPQFRRPRENLQTGLGTIRYQRAANIASARKFGNIRARADDI
ncbi:hypothetical protein V1520DRAFT_345140 [Lipomyces starkeyi]